MAGGTFDKYVGKVLPGTYTNFKSGKTQSVYSGTRGTVIIPITESTYGPAGEFITLTSASPDAAFAKLGYSIYDIDSCRQMLLIREAFKKASTVLVYILAEGDKATATIVTGLTATATYGGTRGNELTVTISANTISGYDVTVHLGGSKVASYEGLTTIEELIAQDCPYITFTGSGDLSPTETAGITLTGGTDGEATTLDYTTFFEAWESVKFNTVCLPVTDSSIQTAAKTQIEYMRDSAGKGVQVVMPDCDEFDYQGVINVTNSVELDDATLSHAEACAYVAAATAAATYVESLTYTEYEGAISVVDPKTHAEAVAAIDAGELFFSMSEAGDVIILYDINSLTTFTDEIDSNYRKNRVIRVLDSFQESVQLNFPPNKYDNNATGWEIMEGIGRTLLKQYEDAGAIQNVDYDNDFLVDTDLSSGDETYFNVALRPVDSSEKLYFTITTS